MISKTLLALQHINQYLNEHPDIKSVHTNSEIIAKFLEKDRPEVKVHYYNPEKKKEPTWKGGFRWHFGNNEMFWMDEVEKKDTK